MSNSHHLAQLNIARILYPTDDPRMSGFMDNLDAINALAEETPGFVWRLIGDGNDATSLRPFPEDDMLLINMSVWTDPDSLHHYTYKTAHAKYVGMRKQWFEVMAEAFFCMWWIPAGTTPTLQDARTRLDSIRANGPTPFAFNFKTRFDAPSE